MKNVLKPLRPGVGLRTRVGAGRGRKPVPLGRAGLLRGCQSTARAAMRSLPYSDFPLGLRYVPWQKFSVRLRVS